MSTSYSSQANGYRHRVLHVFYTETLGYAQGNGNLLRCAVHGIDIGEIDTADLYPKCLSGTYIRSKRTPSISKSVVTSTSFRPGREDGGIISDTISARFVLQFNAFGEVSDEAEFTEGSYFCSHAFYALLINSRIISVISVAPRPQLSALLRVRNFYDFTFYPQVCNDRYAEHFDSNDLPRWLPARWTCPLHRHPEYGTSCIPQVFWMWDLAYRYRHSAEPWCPFCRNGVDSLRISSLS